jgi:two-component system response regulator FlrC
MVVSDVNMPGLSGHDLLNEVQRLYPGLPMMLITAYGQISHAVSAMQAGAIDYLVKPFEPQVLVDAVSKVVGGANQKSTDAPVAEDPVSKRMFQLAAKVASSDSTVMISGESGTGKEVLARYIHQQSPRADQPFVAINCAAIPENMLEAMLFGYEKGAFTGAYSAMPGKFEQADGGTILLDEITEMDMGLQAKLLRVLQERQVERLGGKKTIDLDVRIIATTNRELADYVAEGNFREDLYYRLTVFPLQWLPLRERRDDILPLARRLLAHHADKMKRPAPSLHADAERKLVTHSWPGNVRELDNTVQRALIMQTGNQLNANDFILTPVPKHRQVSAPVSVDAADVVQDEGELGSDLRTREVELIVRALKEEPSRKEAAERLGISPRTLRYKVARLRDEGVDVESMVLAAS